MPDKKAIIFLTGMPAAGKTYWGRELAQAYSLQLTDLDYYISMHEQASIQALFAQYGEAGFREREHKYLLQVIANASGGSIVACGGGTPCFSGNMQLMKDAGTVVYLQADVQTLLFNLETSDDERPLLTNRTDLPEYLGDMLAKRKSWYEQADHILQTKDISLITFDKIISLCINRP